MGDARTCAVKVIKDVLLGRSLTRTLKKSLPECIDKEKSKLQQLVYGAFRDYPRLFGILEQILDRPLKTKDTDLKALIILGIYELEHMNIPAYATVASMVELVQYLGKPWAKGLVNAVLRRFLREKETVLSRLTNSQQTSHPSWMYNTIIDEYPEKYADIFAANNEAPPLTIRINQRRIDRISYLSLLKARNIASKPGILAKTSVYLKQGMPADDIPGFRNGMASVQDEGAQMAASLLPVKAGEHVLDACAAPGGKAAHLLEAYPDIRMSLLDIDRERIVRVTENLDRLGFSAHVTVGDACAGSEIFKPESFDQIIADVPCSALGVVRRNPDIKVLRRPTDINSFSSLQKNLLKGLWPTLKPDGHLLYVTCSILRYENDEVIGTHVKNNANCKCIPIKEAWGFQTKYGRQLLQTVGQNDGLYFSLLRKAS